MLRIVSIRRILQWVASIRLCLTKPHFVGYKMYIVQEGFFFFLFGVGGCVLCFFFFSLSSADAILHNTEEGGEEEAIVGLRCVHLLSCARQQVHMGGECTSCCCFFFVCFYCSILIYYLYISLFPRVVGSLACLCTSLTALCFCFCSSLGISPFCFQWGCCCCFLPSFLKYFLKIIFF